MRNEFWSLKAEVFWFPGEVEDVPPKGGRRAAGTAIAVVGWGWDQHSWLTSLGSWEIHTFPREKLPCTKIRDRFCSKPNLCQHMTQFLLLGFDSPARALFHFPGDGCSSSFLVLPAPVPRQEESGWS